MAAKLARFSWVPGGLAAALVIVAGRWFSPNSALSLEAPVYDAVLRAAEQTPSTDLALIAIDEESLSKLGPWPWPADVHASLLSRLALDDARVIAFTAPFGNAPRSVEVERLRAALTLLESSDLGSSAQAQQLRELLRDAISGRDTNATLANIIAEHGDVVLPIVVEPTADAASSLSLPDHLVPQLEMNAAAHRAAELPHANFIASASAVGHILFLPDADGRIRSDLAFVALNDQPIPSMAIAVAARALDVDAADLSVSADQLVIGQTVVPLDEQLRYRPHLLRTEAFGSRRYSYSEVLAGEVEAGAFTDKVVIIGFDPGTLATAVSNASGPLTITASAVSAILENSTYATPAWARIAEWIAYAAVVAFAAFALPASGILIGTIGTALIALALLVTEVGLLSSANVWVRFVLPCLAAFAGLGLYAVGELLRRANVGGAASKDSAGNLRSLGQTFQKQGQLDLAFETYRRCPLDPATMELLYYLGMDFERRRQLQKASAVYAYIAGKDPNYRDLRGRRTRLQREQALRDAPVTRPAPRVVAQSEPRDESDPASVPRASRTLGRYEIERELGKGAMGVVYLGRDPNINRIVAIKAISLAEEFEEADLAEARARFFREAEMAGRLNHPAIVTVYDAGEDQGLAYIAMEYLRGQHLSHFTDPAHLLPPKSVMLLVARVADALHYAHRQNVVHRDIKPANIMFNPDTDELKITDFGIARLTDTSRTKTGIVLGTPSFMSPEQLEGRTLDGRSDQFALGITLYQLLCGQLPFRAESMPRLMQKIATEPHAAVRTLRPDLPPCVDVIINRALAKDADARYVTCAEMALALRECANASGGAQPAQESEKHEWLLP